MTQSWRMFSGVALGAMLAGWLVVRLLRSSPEVTVVDHPTKAAADLPAASPETARGAETTTSAAPQPGSLEAPRALRERDLIALENALLRDRRISDRLLSFPGIIRMPSVLPYRHATEFWQPALAKATRSRQ